MNKMFTAETQRLPGRNWISIFVVAFVVSCIGTSVNGQKVDRSRLSADVKTEFVHAWNGYKQYCWGHDDLKPLT